MRRINNISSRESLYSVIRFLDMLIGILGVILISFFTFIVGPDGGGEEYMWLYYMGMVYTVPFIALILNGILNKWEKPPGRAISIILFVIFVISTALAALMFYDLLQRDLPTPEGSEHIDIVFKAFIGVLTLLFLINALMTLRGIFRKKPRELKA